jgi:hypothetical protein
MNAITPAGQRTAAWILGDARQGRVVGVTSAPALFGAYRQMVRRLAHGYGLGEGSDRWRRTFYEPPEGWPGVALGHATMWIAPACPMDHAVLTVFHARPARPTAAGQQERLLFQQPVVWLSPGDPEPVENGHGMPAERRTSIATVEGRALALTELVLADDRYLYPMTLEVEADKQAHYLQTLLDVARSVRPLPRLQAGASHAIWTE